MNRGKIMIVNKKSISSQHKLMVLLCCFFVIISIWYIINIGNLNENITRLMVQEIVSHEIKYLNDFFHKNQDDTFQNLPNIQGQIKPIFQQNSFAYLINSDGLLIKDFSVDNSIIQNINILNNTNSIYVKYDNSATIFENIKKGNAGKSIFNIYDKEMYIDYQPIGINDLYLMFGMDNNLLKNYNSSYVNRALQLTIIIALLCICLTIFFYFYCKKNTEQLNTIAYYDSFIGIRNINGFKIDLSKILKINQNKDFDILYFDIDRFQFVNEFFGYEQGTAIINKIAQESTFLRDKFTIIAHVYGDKFMLFYKRIDKELLYEKIEEYKNIVLDQFLFFNACI